jgi:hypothetical protein
LARPRPRPPLPCIVPGVNIHKAWTGTTGATGLEGITSRTEFNILS